MNQFSCPRLAKNKNPACRSDTRDCNAFNAKSGSRRRQEIYPLFRGEIVEPARTGGVVTRSIGIGTVIKPGTQTEIVNVWEKQGTHIPPISACKIIQIRSAISVICMHIIHETDVRMVNIGEELERVIA